MAKGQGISINVIVIAAIALLVLVILSTLVIRSSGQINQGTTCEGTGGVCIPQDRYDGACSDTDPDSFTIDRTKACTGSTKDSPKICCRRV